MSNSNISGKEPWLAVNLSRFLPGIGQIYAGKVTRGWILIAVTLLCYFFGYLQLFFTVGHPLLGISLLLGGVIIWIWSLFDSHYCARKANNFNFEYNRKREKDAWLAVFLSTVVFPGVGHIYLKKWLFAIVWIHLAITFIFLAIIFGELVYPYFLIYHVLIAYHAYISTPNRRERSRKPILVICLLVLFLSSNDKLVRNVGESRYVPSGSMLPTLGQGDRLFVNKIIYRFSSPQRKDVVIFYATDEAAICSPGRGMPIGEVYIKRIIGLPGETAEVKNEQVYINNQALAENYIQEAPNYSLPSVTIPSESYFVSGDNRNQSCDSHVWGFVPREHMIGKATNIVSSVRGVGAIQ